MSLAPAITRDLGERLGPYVLLELIGEGAMGRVYLGEHAALGRKVAIKVLRSAFMRDAFVVSRFFAEARAVNQICHENIVEITDFVHDDEQTAYFVMEYLQGTLLSQASKGAKMAPERVARIGRQMASALGAVHALGVVHRDLKPDNVMLVERAGVADFVKLLDFGAAKVNQDVVPGAMPSQPLSIVGTPQYMSPEQATGAPVDHRADIYALGVVMYELLTGANPFVGTDMWSTIQNQVKRTPPAPPASALSKLVMRCLHKKPKLRPESMQEVAEGLSQAVGKAGFGSKLASFFK